MNRTVDTLAADWFARLQRDDVTAADQAELDRWLDADPAHAVAFARTEFTWERAKRLGARPLSVNRATPRPRLMRRTTPWAAAATLALTVAGSILYFIAPWNDYSTAIGERRTVSLEDGTQVSLNTASSMEVEFDRRTRTLHLESGEALFKVLPDAHRPFIVKAGQTSVMAIGTAFNVRIRNQVIEVVVTEGVVGINGRERIPAGSAAIVAGDAINRVALTEDELRRRVLWREGVIELQGETLERAVEEFNRYRTRKIVVADPAIATLRVGGRFEADEARKFVNALGANFGVRAVDSGGRATYLMGPPK